MDEPRDSGLSLFTVLGKPVTMSDGVLVWGTESLGPVSEGDGFVVDQTGIRRE